MRVANVCVYCVCMRRRNWPRCLSNSRRVFMIQCNDQSVCMGVNVCVYCVCVCMYVCVCVIVFVFVLVCVKFCGGIIRCIQRRHTLLNACCWCCRISSLDGMCSPMYTKATHPTNRCILLGDTLHTLLLLNIHRHLLHACRHNTHSHTCTNNFTTYPTTFTTYTQTFATRMQTQYTFIHMHKQFYYIPHYYYIYTDICYTHADTIHTHILHTLLLLQNHYNTHTHLHTPSSSSSTPGGLTRGLRFFALPGAAPLTAAPGYPGKYGVCIVVAAEAPGG